MNPDELIAKVSGTLAVALFVVSVIGVVAAPLHRPIIARTTDIYRRETVSKLMLELDVVVDPGDSGAAVLDGTGAVVGVINSFAAEIDHTFALHRDEILDWSPNSVSSADGIGSCSR